MLDPLFVYTVWFAKSFNVDGRPSPEWDWPPRLVHVASQRGMTMDVELQINNSVSPEARFVSWAPSACRVRVTDPSGATTPTVSVTITGVSAAGGGAVVFRSGTTGAFSNGLTL